MIKQRPYGQNGLFTNIAYTIVPSSFRQSGKVRQVAHLTKTSQMVRKFNSKHIPFSS